MMSSREFIPQGYRNAFYHRNPSNMSGTHSIFNNRFFSQTMLMPFSLLHCNTANKVIPFVQGFCSVVRKTYCVLRERFHLKNIIILLHAMRNAHELIKLCLSFDQNDFIDQQIRKTSRQNDAVT